MIKIRRFSSDDQDLVVNLVNTIMNQEFHDHASAYPNDDLMNIPQTYGGLGEAFFVAAKNGDIVGTVAVKKEDERVALMRRLFVAEPYRKQQIGLKLIERALQFCDEVGYQEVIFKTTSSMERANKICQKSGFIQRAKLQLGSVELFKFALSLRDHAKK